MDTIVRDVRFALRLLRKSPGAAAVSALALALGIGANVSCFITVNALVLHPLAYPEMERLVTLWETPAQARGALDSVAPANFLDWQARSRSFTAMAAYRPWDAVLTGAADPERVQACAASAALFDVLALRPAMGRVFTAAETEPGRDGVVVVSDGFWRARMGAARDAVGRTLTLGGRPYRVIGVMPEDFDFPLATGVWAPLALTPTEKTRRATRDLMVLARLAPGVSLDRARAELDAISRQLAVEYPDAGRDRAISAVRLRDRTNNVTETFSVTLLGAAMFVLLLACANVANLQLSRAAARHKTIALQAALGAGRTSIARQIAFEGILLSIAGGAGGLFFASWSTDMTRTILIPPIILRYVAGIRHMRVEGAVLWFTLGASIIAGLLCAVPAAWHSLRVRGSLSASLQEGGRIAGLGRGRSRLSRALVVFEVAAALVLLVGAGLMVGTSRRLLTVSPGYDTRNLLTMQVSLPYRDAPRVTAFYDRAFEQLGAIAGVRFAGGSSDAPAAGGLFIEGRPDPQPADPIPAVRAVTPRYLQTLGLPLVEGRFLSAQDGADSPRVVVLAASVARHYWPGGGAIGRRVRLARGAPWLTVAGIAGDVHDWFTHEPLPLVYVPFPQAPQPALGILLRTEGAPVAAAPAARAAFRAVDPAQPVYDVESMQQIIEERSSGVRAAAVTMTAYAAIALLLALTGIYAVLAWSVARRTHEIGVRMALGANPGAILRMTVADALRMAGAGLAIGIPICFLLMRAVSRVLYNVVVVDPLAIGGLALLLGAAALAAGYIPARQATRVDPLTALRVE